MKLRRLLAALLVLVLVITSSPVVYASATGENAGQNDSADVGGEGGQEGSGEEGQTGPTGSGEENPIAPIADAEVQTLSAANTDYMRLSSSITNNTTYISRTDQNVIGADQPTIATLLTDAVGEFNKDGEQWNWFAYKVSVQAAGTYTLGVKVKNAKFNSYLIPLCVNDEVYTLTYTSKNQQQNAEVTLPAGEHVVVMFMPMRASKDKIEGNNSNDFPWCDVESVIVDNALTVAAPTVAEVEACFAPKTDTVISAADSNYMLWSATVGAKEEPVGTNVLYCVNSGHMRWDKPVIETLYTDAVGQFNQSGGEWNWFAYNVNAPAAGTYTLGVKVNNVNLTGYSNIPLCVNGNVYTLKYTEKPQQVTVEATLTAGKNTVVMFMPMPEKRTSDVTNNGTYYPWCNVESMIVDYALTISKPTVAEVEACFAPPVKEDAVISAVDTNYLLLSETIGKNGKLSRTDQATLKVDAPTIETLYSDAVGQFNASGSEWNWFAYKVSVPEAGTYTLGVKTAGSKYASYKLPLCVNNELYALSYTAKSQLATTEVTLPAGEHVVVMLMPLPANKSAISGNEWNDYHWCDVESVTVDGELTVSKPTVAEVEAVFAPKTISAVNTDVILLSATIQKNAAALGRTDQSTMKADAPTIETLYSDAIGEFNKSGEEWNWFAYKINVPVEGTYTLGVKTTGSKYASYKLPLYANGELYALNYTAKSQEVTTEVTLAAGDNVVVMFMPMPATKAAISGNEWNDYHWCDVGAVTVPAGLKVTKPTVAEVEACFTSSAVNSPLWKQSVLFVGDSITYSANSWASVIGNAYKMDWTNGGISGATISDLRAKIIRHQLMANHNESYDYVIMHGGINDADAGVGTVSDSWNVADFDTSTYAGGLETLFYYAYENYPGAKLGYIVNYATPNADTSKWKGTNDMSAYFAVGKQICDKWGIAYIDLYFGKTADGKSYSYDILKVDKVAANFINNDATEIHLSAAGYNLISPYIAEWMETLTVNTSPIPTANSGKHIDANDTGKVLYGGFTPKSVYTGGTVYVGLQDRVYTGMSEDGANIEMLPYAKDMLGDWAFASIAVDAAQDGDYTFKVEMAAKVSYQMGMLVDGEAYTLNYSMDGEGYYRFMEQTVSLTKGTHYISFTAAMPNNDNELDGDAWNVYPWTNIAAIVVDEGLEVQSAPKLSDVTSKLGAYEPFYTRVEAENTEYVIYNNYNTPNESSANASGGTVVGGAWTSTYKQTFEELEAWLDSNHNAYVEYAVVAPESGEYEIRVGFLAGSNDKSVAKPHIAVVVNNTTYKAQFSKDWNQVDKVKLTVNLKEGLNIIRCTSMTVDQPIYGARGWINHDFIDLDTRLTPVKHSSDFMEAETAKYYNKFKVQDGGKDEGATGKVLGSSDRKYISGQNLTLDTFLFGQLKQVPYFSVTVNAPMDGYYPISLKMSIDGRLKNSSIGMIVDDFVYTVKYDKSGKQADQGKVDTLVYLTKGEHVLTFTAPMPADATIDANYSYYWCNYDSITLYDGLTFAKNQKEPIWDPDYTRIEVEDYAMFNLSGNNGHAAGNAVYNVSQSVAEIMKNGIDGTKTPYIELKVNAKEAGPYAIFVGTTYGINEGGIWEEVYGQFVVDVNGKLETKTVQIHKSTASTVVLVWIILEEGENTVRLTHLTSDAQHGGTTWIDFDYIEMPYWVTKGIEFVKPGERLEAEDSNFDAFAEEAGSGFSGGACLGRVNYDTVEDLNITFDTLDPSDMSGLPYVAYRVFTEKAGTYSLAVGFKGGLTNYSTEEKAQGVNASFAVVVNGETKQRVEFILKGDKSMARIINVDLKEGENEIIVTGATSEYVIDRNPRNDETYRLVWINQDYLALPADLTSMSMNEDLTNIDDSDIDFGQLSAKERSEQDTGDVSVVEPVSEAGNGFGWIWIVAGIGTAFILFLILLIGKKRKKEEEEE